ncbi:MULTISPECIES: methylaspartate mutase subunit E [Eubacteriales]|uniref:Glutamate mutase epsilon subunit n=1 Tax=Bittarella massiliensis (ex Durand et al. 2017) TaxID=1720313 RepID=A0AAQ1MBY1_9FIRM|nr:MULTISPECIES: methylaspartate mutase subunit E [Eubacteriales]ERI98114.1 methylaspartate mutase, E subunit [Clostridium sp. ATCC 29733]MZL69564.1 methylaspartate mutase subunit E [Bittarella massiliensis (ex Durand et al. 2017)]MZL80481.1 methylaspartate mutase subunit E [Bittarella massiliensis (ex Durand et al. 2017)]SHF78435.1 Glutamate mutase subunit E [Bittarella massiliensis (ex Durand et al. 2017)]
MEIQNKRIEDGAFQQIRQEVLGQWPTGREVDLQEAFDFHRKLPESKVFSRKLSQAKREGKTLIQPRAGVALIKEHIELLTYLQDKGEADLLPTTIDSYTRQNRYEDAEKGIVESAKSQKSMLNGLPAVNHGVAGCRQIIQSLDIPVQIRHGTPDARLLTEICYAAGFTSYEGGGISYNVPYAKNVPLERTILDWQYCDRLTGLYEEAGIPINREPYGPLTGTLVPPCISHAVAIIESLLAAEQGVKNITVGYGQCGNLVQDVAAIRTLEELTDEYLEKYGYTDVEVTTVLHQWMGGFPQDEAKAFGVISWGSAAAALAKATKVIVKTPHEAMGIPTMEANAQGLRCTKQVISMLSDQTLTAAGLEEEKQIIAAETRCIVDKCFELGGGDIALGAVRAFQAGVLDVPFAPSRFNAGKMLSARDNDGAIRILDAGAVPLSPELVDYNRKKIEERAAFEKRKASFQMVIDDVYAISKGRLVGRPWR